MPSEAAARQFERMTPEEQGQSQLRLDHLALIENLDFSSAVIEGEIAGAPAPGTFEGARGFVGIAFRVKANNTHDAFYLRPTNGRAEDQARRNRSVQYIRTGPALRPRSRTAGADRHGVKSGAYAKGAVALWVDPGTVAPFRNLTVEWAIGLTKADATPRPKPQQ